MGYPEFIPNAIDDCNLCKSDDTRATEVSGVFRTRIFANKKSWILAAVRGRSEPPSGCQRAVLSGCPPAAAKQRRSRQPGSSTGHPGLRELKSLAPPWAIVFRPYRLSEEAVASLPLCF